MFISAGAIVRHVPLRFLPVVVPTSEGPSLSPDFVNPRTWPEYMAAARIGERTCTKSLLRWILLPLTSTTHESTIPTVLSPRKSEVLEYYKDHSSLLAAFSRKKGPWHPILTLGSHNVKKNCSFCSSSLLYGIRVWWSGLEGNSTHAFHHRRRKSNIWRLILPVENFARVISDAENLPHVQVFLFIFSIYWFILNRFCPFQKSTKNANNPARQNFLVTAQCHLYSNHILLFQPYTLASSALNEFSKISELTFLSWISRLWHWHLT